VQKELSEFKTLWDSHVIQQRQTASTIGGRPAVLYNDPESVGFRDCLIPVEKNNDIEMCREFCRSPDRFPCDSTVYKLSVLLMNENRWRKPQDAYKALTLYQLLRTAIVNDL